MINLPPANEIVTNAGFLRAFYLLLKSNPGCTYLSAFDAINEVYKEAYGQPKWNSYDAFRKFRDRHGNK